MHARTVVACLAADAELDEMIAAKELAHRARCRGQQAAQAAIIGTLTADEFDLAIELLGETRFVQRVSRPRARRRQHAIGELALIAR